MCGICGYTGNNKNSIYDMLKLISHRGPDNEGVIALDNVVLGHRRLSIIDLSKNANQPFVYNDKYILCFNGEIYNYLELKEQLELFNYKFNTTSDVEVLIAAYDKYKEECVNHFDGMWSFAIFDILEKKLFCSRDPFGIKPFYYSFKDDELIFASEIKAILPIFEGLCYANNDKLSEFLITGNLDNSKETMFKDVFQLRPGENLIFDLENKQHSLVKWYDISKKFNNYINDKNKIENNLKQKFLKAVNISSRSDVPIGHCLSGGIDSSAIVCAAKYNNKDIVQKTISACYNDVSVDEQKFIDIVNNTVGSSVVKVFPNSQDLFNDLDKIIWHMDEPFGSTSIFAQWEVFKAAKNNGIKVMLDGQGADEQLAGYSMFYIVLFESLLKKGKILSLIKEINAYKKVRSKSDGMTAKSLFFGTICRVLFNEKLYEKIKSIFIKEKRTYIFTPNALNSLFKNKEKLKGDVAQRYIQKSLMGGMQALLHYEDRNSMAFSIEARVPFLNVEFAEYVYNIPIEYKIQNAITKSIFRDALVGILPKEIKERTDKIGFATPEKQWMKQNKEYVLKELEIACDTLEYFVNKDNLIKYYNETYLKTDKRDFVLWRIISAARWVKIFDVKINES